METVETKERLATGKKWEYKAVTLSAETNWQTGLGVKKPELSDADIQTQLNRWGAEGWECFSLVLDDWRGGVNHYTVTNYHAMFKRRVP
jgi:hypothetical protein